MRPRRGRAAKHPPGTGVAGQEITVGHAEHVTQATRTSGKYQQVNGVSPAQGRS